MRHLLSVAYSCLNVPYVYGGNNPLTGLDCSGLMLWILKSTGHILPDMTAQGIFDHFHDKGRWSSYTCGSLCFFGQATNKITHVGMFIDQYRFIEAGGGDSACTTKEIAAIKGACVRISHIKLRKDLVAIVKPDYSLIGVV